MTKINSMQERIAEKDAMIAKMRKQEAFSSKADSAPEDGPLAAELEEERDALTNELSRLRLQMVDTQNTMEDAMETSKVLAVQFEEGAGCAEVPGEASEGAEVYVPADNLAGSIGGADSISAAGSNPDTYVSASSLPGAEFDSFSVPGATLGTSNGIGRRRLPPEPKKEDLQKKTPQADDAVHPKDQQQANDKPPAEPQLQNKDEAPAGDSPKLEAEPPTLNVRQVVINGPPPADELGKMGTESSFMRPVELLSGGLPVADGEKTAKKTMMSWKHLATPEPSPSRHSPQKPTTKAKDDESSDQSGSTPPDSCSTNRSQASPVAGVAGRHTFGSHHDDHSQSASLRLPAVRSDVAKKRSQLDKMFER